MKVVVDTNVLISATFWFGASFRLLEAVENNEIALLISKEILEEFANVLESKEIQEKIKHKNLEMKRTISKVMEISTLIVPTEKLSIVEQDPDDNKILECALTGNTDLIISKDNHLLSLVKFREIPIITPEEALRKLAKQ